MPENREKQILRPLNEILKILDMEKAEKRNYWNLFCLKHDFTQINNYQIYCDIVH